MKEFFIVFSLLGLFVACQSTDYDDLEETTRHQQKQKSSETTEKLNSQGDTLDRTDDYIEEKMETLGINEFKVEIEYDNGKTFEAEVEKDDGTFYTAEVEDELSNNFLMGREAFDFIYENIKELTLKQRAESEVITEIINAFDLTKDYQKIEVEIKFNNGSMIDFDHKQ